MTKQDPDRARFGPLMISVARLWRRAADKALDDCGLSHATAMPLKMLSRLGEALPGVQVGLLPSRVRRWCVSSTCWSKRGW